jgi:hypothetical protein
MVNGDFGFGRPVAWRLLSKMLTFAGLSNTSVFVFHVKLIPA